MSVAVANLWLETTLGESFHTVTGNTPPKSRSELYGDAVPLVKPPELTNGEVSYASDGLTEQGSKFARLAPQGSTLVSCIGNLGKIGLVTTKVAFNQQINAIFPNPKIALPRFIYLLTLSPQFQKQLSALSSGTTVPIVNKSRFNSIRLALPPLDEQKRIVAVLDQAFAALDRACALVEANLADARSLLQTKLHAIFKNFAGKKCRVDELFDVGSSKRVLKSEWKDSGVPFYRGREVTRLALEGWVANELFISEPHYAELEAKTGVPNPGDIMITAIGTIGNAYIVGEGDRFYFKDASVLWMRRAAEALSGYVKFWIRSSSFHDQLERGNGATVDTLTIGKLQSLLIPNPPLDEQKRIVGELMASEKAIKQLESIYDRKLADLATLRQSLLQKAFSGELA